MRDIPIFPVPNQELSVVLADARWTLRLRVALNTMIVDIHRDGEVVVLGQRIVPGEWMIPYQYLVQGVNFGLTTLEGELPWWEHFGDTQRLVALES